MDVHNVIVRVDTRKLKSCANSMSERDKDTFIQVMVHGLLQPNNMLFTARSELERVGVTVIGAAPPVEGDK